MNPEPMIEATPRAMNRRTFLQGSLASGSVLLAPELLAQPSAQPGAGVVSGRPRLFFPPDRIAGLRRRLATDASVQSGWAKLLRRADDLVQARLLAPQDADGGGGKQGNYHEVSDQMKDLGLTLSLAWRMTGDERYARKLREAMLESVGYERWNSENYRQRSPSWRSGLWTAAFSVGCAAGYDALHDFLSVADRQRIAGGMVRLGILPLLEDWVLPERRIHALDSMGHNYFCICPAGAGVGALALFGEDPRALGWMQAVENVFEEFFAYKGQVLQNKPVSFDAAGAYYEGVHYADYPLSQYLVYRLARLNVMPEPKPARIPVVGRMAEFFVHNLYPASKSAIGVNFGDDWPLNAGPGAMRLLAAQGFSPGLVRWYVEQADPEPDDPLALAYYDHAAGAARNPLPLSVAYREIGWAVLRNSWEKDATMLALRSGFTWNHAHADAASFILCHAGEQLLIDPGVCEYHLPQYNDHYRQSRGHNVVLFNGQGQPTEDVKLRGGKFPGRIHSLLDGAGLKYIYADATGPMARHLSRNYRHWLWLDGVILVFDDLLAHEPGRFDWLLHYAGAARRDGSTVEVTNGDAQASVTMLFPADPLIREEEGFAQNDPDRKVTYLAFATSAPAQEQKFIVAIVPQPVDATAPVPKVELLNEPLALGVRVRKGDTITDVYLNLQADGRRMHLNSNNTIAGWETDAYLFALTRPAASAAATPENVTRYFVSAASYLRKEGQTVLHSLSKMEAVFRPGAQMEILIEGQKRIAATLFSPRKPAALSVNGKAAAFEHQPKERTIRFRHAS